MADIEERTRRPGPGSMDRDRTDWPLRWSIETSERAVFFSAIRRFASNHAGYFGALLTPLVSGLRVRGPFAPKWLADGDSTNLVLLDGEGLGHTPDSASSIPTGVTKRFEDADAIVLVDNAKQPMAAGALTVLRTVVASGHDAKLRVVFTHFDQVTGDNLPTSSAKRAHVRGALDNAIASVEASPLGSDGAAALRRALDGRVHFLGGLKAPLGRGREATVAQLRELLSDLQRSYVVPIAAEAQPVYDTANLVIAITTATRRFTGDWALRLPPEHWTRVKALSRRLGYFGEDHYEELTPVGDFISAVQEEVRQFIDKPRGWAPAIPANDEERQAAMSKVAQEVFSRLHGLAAARLHRGPVKQWQTAYDLRGQGTGNQRKFEVRAIYDAAAPTPGNVPTSATTDFLDEVRALFREAAVAAGAKVVN
jgi:hypothetical protein